MVAPLVIRREARASLNPGHEEPACIDYHIAFPASPRGVDIYHEFF